MRRALRPEVAAALLAAVVATSVLLSGRSVDADTAAAIQAATGTGAISGVVTDGNTNSPLPGATVSLGPASRRRTGRPNRQITDARGRFLFDDLTPHEAYLITVSQPGYFDGRYGTGSRGGPGAPIALREAQWFQRADVALFRPGAISGRVFDERGDSVVGAYVRVLARMLVGGRPQMVAGHVARTDDRGEYRIAGLEAGRYLVQVPAVQRALPIDGRPAVYPPTLHPGARELSSATTIEVVLGAERRDIDIRLDPVPTYRVSGRVRAPSQAVASLTLRLMPPGAESLGSGSEVATAPVGGDGTFTFLGVPAGPYTLVADRHPSQYEARFTTGASDELPLTSSPDGAYAFTSDGTVLSGPTGLRFRVVVSSRNEADVWWGRRAIDVASADLDDVVLPLRRAATFSGRFVWEAGTDSPPPFPRTVRLEPAGGDPTLGMPRGRAPTTPAGEFEVPGLKAGRYILVVADAHVKSVEWDGRDHTRRPFDATSGEDVSGVTVTLTTRSAIVSGTTRGAQDTRPDARGVIVFPEESEQWSDFGFSPARVKAVVADGHGAFRLDSLPDGDYLALCVALDRIDAWKDPELLAKLAPLATRVTLRWGETATIELREVRVE
jgi:hypothetical protein